MEHGWLSECVVLNLARQKRQVLENEHLSLFELPHCPEKSGGFVALGVIGVRLDVFLL